MTERKPAEPVEEPTDGAGSPPEEDPGPGLPPGFRGGGEAEETFRSTLHGLLLRMGWRPREVGPGDRAGAFGLRGTRALMDPAYWAVLEGWPSRPTILADVDLSTDGLERSVARYVWWVNRAGPFWSAPSIVVSGLVCIDGRADPVHRTIAEYLGHELCRMVPGCEHLVVEVAGEGPLETCGRRLAHVAFDQLCGRLEPHAEWRIS